MVMHSGGLVNVVTRSGTNSYHGSAFEFIRNNYIDATNFFSTAKDTLHQNQYGGTFGGKIILDKLFAFAAYQRERMTQSTTASTNAYMCPLRLTWQGIGPTRIHRPAQLPTIAGNPSNCSIHSLARALPGNKYATAPTYNAQALALTEVPAPNQPGL
jgi:hypothetical protein